MKILRIDPEPPDPGSVIARLGVQVSDDCRVFGLKLVERPDGRRMIFAPQAGGTRVATLSPKLTAKIVRAASLALMEPDAHDHAND